ncbi:MAG: hypothetical protein IJN20_03715 [Oscillospiraceae bacterium]|nr:hypothetical protein [Oscillospiraceae bacterium]
MYSYANFEISLTASDADRSKIAEFLATKLENQADVFDVTEWPATSFHVEELAIALAQFAIHASFNMDGCIVNDYASSDFSIAYANGTLTVDSNEDAEYDAIMIQFDYPDYEMFCDRFWDDDNDCPLYTEEEYEEFCTWEPAFVVDDGRILPHEPSMGTSKKYKVTPDAVILESSGKDWDDDDEDWGEED